MFIYTCVCRAILNKTFLFPSLSVCSLSLFSLFYTFLLFLTGFIVSLRLRQVSSIVIFQRKRISNKSEVSLIHIAARYSSYCRRRILSAMDYAPVCLYIGMAFEIELVDLNFNCTCALKFRIVHVRLRIYVIVAVFCLSAYMHADDTISPQAWVLRSGWYCLKSFSRVFVSYCAIVRHSRLFTTFTFLFILFCTQLGAKSVSLTIYISKFSLSLSLCIAIVYAFACY